MAQSRYGPLLQLSSTIKGGHCCLHHSASSWSSL